jgi:hypothetical protein
MRCLRRLSRSVFRSRRRQETCCSSRKTRLRKDRVADRADAAHAFDLRIRLRRRPEAEITRTRMRGAGKRSRRGRDERGPPPPRMSLAIANSRAWARSPGRPFPYRSERTPAQPRYACATFASGGRPRNTRRVARSRQRTLAPRAGSTGDGGVVERTKRSPRRGSLGVHPHPA